MAKLQKIAKVAFTFVMMNYSAVAGLVCAEARSGGVEIISCFEKSGNLRIRFEKQMSERLAFGHGSSGTCDKDATPVRNGLQGP